MEHGIPRESSLHGDQRTQIRPGSAAVVGRGDWPGAALSIALLVALVLGLFWQTTWSMALIWARSVTFAHGFVVFPIFFYLVWRQRDVLAEIEPVPCYPALLGVAGAGALWLVGELVSAASVSQVAMVAMIPFVIWGVLGTGIVRALGIPLGFLFFAVPLGEFLVPTMMDWTADVAIAAIRASGVPVYRQGNFFTIPSGSWSVVEACSGLRYLIASFMVGSLFAYLSYRSPYRRIAFIILSIVVPIVANWLRAYMIVMLGHLTNNRIAVGADHAVYGWVLFGIVIYLLLWIGSRWREDENPLPPHEAAIPAGFRARSKHRIWVAVLAAFVLMAIWQPIDAWLQGKGTAAVAQLQQIGGSVGWVEVPAEVSAWHPDVSGARAEIRESFEKGAARVGLHILYFRNQTPETKAITSRNQLVSTTNLRWKLVGKGTAPIHVNGQNSPARTAIVSGERDQLLVWQWFWVDGRVTSSEYVAKIFQVISVMRGRGDPVAWVLCTHRSSEARHRLRRPWRRSPKPCGDPSMRRCRKLRRNDDACRHGARRPIPARLSRTFCTVSMSAVWRMAS